MTVLRLLVADLVKLSRLWIVAAGFGAMLLFCVASAVGTYYLERSIGIPSSSGWDFAINLMLRCLDFGSFIVYVLTCLLFSLEISNATVKCILTRGVTRVELLVSKYLTAVVLVSLAVAMFWGISLGAAHYYYGLGDLTENEYVIFEAGYMVRQLAVGSLLLLIPLAALIAMGLAVSTWSSTMGGAIVIGILLFVGLQALSVVPAAVGVQLQWGGEPQLFSLSSLGFVTQLFVPMYRLDDLPTGVPIDDWWSFPVQRMTLVCGAYFLLFGGISLIGARKRDFCL